MLQWAEENTHYAGLLVVGSSEETSDVTNKGVRSARIRCLNLAVAKERAWRVTKLTDLEEKPVFCAVVPGANEFTLSTGILTGNCGWSDKQSLPAIVGFNPSKAAEDDMTFTIQCPNCESVTDRSNGAIDIWMERQILMGVDEARIGHSWFKRGEIVTEFTELAVTCNECQYFCGEDE